MIEKISFCNARVVLCYMLRYIRYIIYTLCICLSEKEKLRSISPALTVVTACFYVSKKVPFHLEYQNDIYLYSLSIIPHLPPATRLKCKFNIQKTGDFARDKISVVQLCHCGPSVVFHTYICA